MTKSDSVTNIIPNFPDPQKLATAWTSIYKNGFDALQTTTKRRGAETSPLPYDPTAAMRALSDFTATIFSNPTQIFSAQRKFMLEWNELWTAAIGRALGHEHEPVIAVERGDRRFSNPAWTEVPAYEFLKQAYLLTSRQVLDLVAESKLEPDARTRVEFYTKQFLNALAQRISHYQIPKPFVPRSRPAASACSLALPICWRIARHPMAW